MKQPRFSLLLLETEYMRSERTCWQRIYEVHQFSEQFLGSVVEVPPLDEFRDHVVPSAAESSAQILRTVRKQIQSTREPPAFRSLPPATCLLTFRYLPEYAVLTVFPQLQGHFSRFEHDLPIADASMQRMYATLRRLVRPLEQPDDPREGVLRSMEPTQLRDEHFKYNDLRQKWAAVQLPPSHGGPHPFS